MLREADYMDRALFLAERGRGRTSPNPLVGAVVVSDEGLVVGQGFHERAGEPHAEIRALDMADRRAAGATLFCTLFVLPALLGPAHAMPTARRQPQTSRSGPGRPVTEPAVSK